VNRSEHGPETLTKVLDPVAAPEAPPGALASPRRDFQQVGRWKPTVKTAGPDACEACFPRQAAQQMGGAGALQAGRVLLHK